MNFTRRNVLRFGLTASPTVWQFWLPLTAEAQCALPLPIASATAYTLPATTVQIRQSVMDLAADATRVTRLRNAVAGMKALPAADRRNWEAQARLHCATCGGGAPTAEDIHFTWSFLPWHRAFLYFHERILNQRINRTDLRIPFWNWEAAGSRVVPPIYAAAAPNSLLDTRRPLAALRDSEVNVRPALALTASSDFFGTADDGGAAYGGPHASVHNWTRGTMRSPQWSPRDPLFYAHHANIDRLWESWLRLGGVRANPTDAAFRNKRIYFFDEGGNWRFILFSQLLNTDALGYRYASHMTLPTPPGPVPPISMTLTSNVGNVNAADVNKLGSEARYLVIRKLKGLEKLPASMQYGVFANPPSGALSTESPSFLGSFGDIIDTEHNHSLNKPRTVSLEVTGKLRGLLTAGQNKLRMRVHHLDENGKAQGSGIDLAAANVQLI